MPSFVWPYGDGLSFGGDALCGAVDGGKLGRRGRIVPTPPPHTATYLARATRTRVYLWGMDTRLPGRVVRKRKRLFTQQELARELGVHRNTLSALERSPLPPLLVRYLRTVGYNVAFYPVRKGRE